VYRLLEVFTQAKLLANLSLLVRVQEVVELAHIVITTTQMNGNIPLVGVVMVVLVQQNHTLTRTIVIQEDARVSQPAYRVQ
jgi:hypothetical protein